MGKQRACKGRTSASQEHEQDPLQNGNTSQGGKRKTGMKGHPRKKRAVTVDKMPVLEDRRTVVIKPQDVAKWVPVDTNIRRFVSQTLDDAFSSKMRNGLEKEMIAFHQQNLKSRLIPLMQMPVPKKLGHMQIGRGHTEDLEKQQQSVLEAQRDVTEALRSLKHDISDTKRKTTYVQKRLHQISRINNSKQLCSRENDILHIPPLPPASFSSSSSSDEEMNMED